MLMLPLGSTRQEHMLPRDRDPMWILLYISRGWRSRRPAFVPTICLRAE
jgi:hypothetical protein